MPPNSQTTTLHPVISESFCPTLDVQYVMGDAGQWPRRSESASVVRLVSSPWSHLLFVFGSFPTQSPWIYDKPRARGKSENEAARDSVAVMTAFDLPHLHIINNCFYFPSTKKKKITGLTSLQVRGIWSPWKRTWLQIS